MKPQQNPKVWVSRLPHLWTHGDTGRIASWKELGRAPGFPVHCPVCLLQMAVAVVVVQSLSHVWLFATPWIAASQASLSWAIFLPNKLVGLPRWLSGEESACQCTRHGLDPWVRKIPWRRKGEPSPVILPGKFHGPRSLAGYSPWDCRSQTQLNTHTHAQ